MVCRFEFSHCFYVPSSKFDLNVVTVGTFPALFILTLFLKLDCFTVENGLDYRVYRFSTQSQTFLVLH